MSEPIFLIILFVGLVIATYRDIRIREVPDTLTYGLMTTGSLGGVIISVIQLNVWIFVEHLLGFLAGALLGVIMFYGRQWGGGDAKLMMGLGAILGLSWTNLQVPMFIVLLIFSGAIYGIIYTIVLSVVHRKKFKKQFFIQLREEKFHRVRKYLVFTGIIVIIGIVFAPMDMKITLGAILLSAYILVYSWVFLKTIEKTALVKKYPVSKLTEGDWIIQTIKRGRKVIVNEKNTGVTKKQIAELKKHNVKAVTVKEGIPFVPGFLIAFILLLWLQYMNWDLLLLSIF